MERKTRPSDAVEHGRDHSNIQIFNDSLGSQFFCLCILYFVMMATYYIGQDAAGTSSLLLLPGLVEPLACRFREVARSCIKSDSRFS